MNFLRPRMFFVLFIALGLALSAMPVTAGFVTVDGNRFLLDGQAWYPYGVNYFPSFYEEQPPAGQDRNWLQDIYYNQPGNREQVDRELDKVRDLGFNYIIIQGIKDERYCPNLVDFLNKAQSRGLKVGIFMQWSDPFANLVLGSETYQRDLRIIQTCNLAGNEAVFGYELDWEPSVEFRWIDQNNVQYASKRRNLPQAQESWNTWISKNYGNIDAAVQNWNFNPAGSLDDNGRCISHTVPARALVNVPYTIMFTLRNTGTNTWTQDIYSLSFIGTPLPLPSAVAPGQEISLTFSYTVPPVPAGPIPLSWQMTKNNRPFGEICSSSTTFVTENPTYPIPVTVFPERARVRTPTDDELCNEGMWQRYTVAYYHFVNDAVSDAYRRMVRTYKSADANHIVYAHVGSPAFDWEQSCRMIEYNKRWSLSKYVDVVPEEFYGSVGAYNTEGFSNTLKKMGFLGGYDFIGKPIVVVEVGYSSECHPVYIGRCSEDDKKRFYETLSDVVYNSPFTGFAAWWFAGRQIDGYSTQQTGSPVYNNYGLVENTTLQEYIATSAIRDRAALLKSGRSWSPATNLVVDPDAFASFQRFFSDSGQRYLALAQQGFQPRVLTTCSDKTSASVETVCVGNAPNTGRCPVKCLHSRFLSLMIKDVQNNWVSLFEHPVIEVAGSANLYGRATIENLQETTWLDGTSSGSVELVAKDEDDAESHISLTRDVPGLSDYATGDFVFSEGIDENTTVEFYLEARGRTRFGDTASVTLVPRMTIAPPVVNRTQNQTRVTEPRPQQRQEPRQDKTPPSKKETDELPSRKAQPKAPEQRQEEQKQKIGNIDRFSSVQRLVLLILSMAVVILALVLVVVYFRRRRRRKRLQAFGVRSSIIAMTCV